MLSMKKLLLAGAVMLTLGTSAQAALFVSYTASGSSTTFLSTRSDAIDLGALLSSFVVDSEFAVILTSNVGTTLSAPSAEGLQVVQGCEKAKALCTEADWSDIVGQGLSLGGTSILQTVLPIDNTQSFTADDVLVTGVSVRSLRLSFEGALVPAAAAAVSGILSVTAVPEPTPLAVMLAGLVGVLYIVRRRLK